MTEGIVRIYMSVVEPEDKGLLWMRPFLDKEGYELLYYGSTGWIKWLPCCDTKGPHERPGVSQDDEVLESIPDKGDTNSADSTFEIKPAVIPPERKTTTCGCPKE